MKSLPITQVENKIIDSVGFFFLSPFVIFAVNLGVSITPPQKKHTQYVINKMQYLSAFSHVCTHVVDSLTSSLTCTSSFQGRPLSPVIYSMSSKHDECLHTQKVSVCRHTFF